MDGQLGFALLIAIALAVVGYVLIKLKEDDGKPPPSHRAEPTPPVDQNRAQARGAPGGTWSNIGWVISIAATVGLILSLNMATTVETYVSPTILGSGGPSEVANLDMMFQKGVAIAGSLAGLGIGVFCIAVGAIIQAILSRD